MLIKGDWKFNTILIALFIFVIGFLSSPTLVSLYPILILTTLFPLFKRDFLAKLPLSSWLLICLTIWAMIVNFIHLDSLVGVRKSFDDLKFYLIGVLFPLSMNYFFTKAHSKHLRLLLNSLLFVVCIAFIYGYIKSSLRFDLLNWSFGDYQNRNGGFTNYMRYGYASSFLIILMVALRLNWSKLPQLFSDKKLMIFITICLLAILTAKTRGALLALCVAFPLILYRFKPMLSKVLVGVGLLFISFILLNSFVLKLNLGRFFNINDGSNTKRMSQFLSAYYSIKERPIAGLGVGQFGYHVADIKKKYNIWSQDYTGHSHNIFLELAANLGLVGVMLFFVFLIAWLWELRATNSQMSSVMVAYVISFVIAGQVENLFDNTNSHLLFFCYALSKTEKFKNSSLGGL